MPGDDRPLPRREPILAALVFLGIASALFLAGWRYRIPWELDQLLSEEWLRNRPLESLFYLHGQPPVLNGLAAAAFALEAGTGIAAGRTLLVLHLAAGAAAVAAFSSLLCRLVVSRSLRLLVLATLLLDPALYGRAFELYYTFHELVLLVAGAFFAERWWRRGRTVDLLAASGAALLLTLTRTLFHPLWAAGVVLILVLGSRSRRRTAAAVAAGTVLLSLAWPLKNELVFGFFGSSSWLGFNVSNSLPVHRRPAPIPIRVRVGTIPESDRQAALAEVPERFRGIPSLAEPMKAEGYSNWNCVTLIPYFRRLLDESVAIARRDPLAVLGRATMHYDAYCQSIGRSRWTGELEPKLGGPVTWARIYELVVYQQPAASTRGLPLSGFHLLLPVLLALPIVRLAKELRSAAAEPLAALLLFDVLFALAMILLVDGFEGNRMKWSTQPLLFLAAAWGAEGAWFGTAIRRATAAVARRVRPPAKRAPTIEPGPGSAP